MPNNQQLVQTTKLNHAVEHFENNLNELTTFVEQDQALQQLNAYEKIAKVFKLAELEFKFNRLIRLYEFRIVELNPPLTHSEAGALKGKKLSPEGDTFLSAKALSKLRSTYKGLSKQDVIELIDRNHKLGRLTTKVDVGMLSQTRATVEVDVETNVDQFYDALKDTVRLLETVAGDPELAAIIYVELSDVFPAITSIRLDAERMLSKFITDDLTLDPSKAKREEWEPLADHIDNNHRLLIDALVRTETKLREAIDQRKETTSFVSNISPS